MLGTEGSLKDCLVEEIHLDKFKEWPKTEFFAEKRHDLKKRWNYETKIPSFRRFFQFFCRKNGICY